MWGKNLRLWFEMFAGMTVSVVGDPSSEQGWLNPTDIERAFLLGNNVVTFNGRKYDPSDKAQRNAFLDGVIKHAGVLCEIKLLERRRLIDPPSLDYRVTPLGRRVDGWGYGPKPGVRKTSLFFAIEAYYRLKGVWKFIVVGAACMAVLNALRFYGEAWQWISGSAFPFLSGAVVALAILIWHLIARRT